MAMTAHGQVLESMMISPVRGSALRSTATATTTPPNKWGRPHQRNARRPRSVALAGRSTSRPTGRLRTDDRLAPLAEIPAAEGGREPEMGAFESRIELLAPDVFIGPANRRRGADSTYCWWH